MKAYKDWILMQYPHRPQIYAIYLCHFEMNAKYPQQPQIYAIYLSLRNECELARVVTSGLRIYLTF